MRYTELQVNTIMQEMRKRYIAGEVDGSEIVIALVAMEQSGRIGVHDIRNILLGIYYGNLGGVIRALHAASKLIDKDMIDNILADVNLEKK